MESGWRSRCFSFYCLLAHAQNNEAVADSASPMVSIIGRRRFCSKCIWPSTPIDLNMNNRKLRAIIFTYINHKLKYYIGKQSLDYCLHETTSSNDARCYIPDFYRYFYVAIRRQSCYSASGLNREGVKMKTN